ncbi:histidine kinase [uncultured Croceitalea sp.]|uniref:sensor histidine kinase n=1 Tax=uncultured Croceitalea sp. TaxID=1798908 RepID=UPI0033061539
MKSKFFIPTLLHVLLWSGLFYFSFINFVQRIKWIKTPEDGIVILTKEFNYVILSCIIIDLIIKGVLFYFSVLYVNKGNSNLLSNFRRNQNLIIVFTSTLIISLLSCYLIVYEFDTVFLNKILSLVIYIAMIHVLLFIIAIAWGVQLKLIKEMKSKQLLKEANLQAELGFLKAQINPHFLFNTLNNLFAESRKSNNPIVSEGIAKLSNIMRYMVREGNLEKVHLDKEIQYIKNYIDLELLRISSSDSAQIKTNFDIDDSTIEVPPFLLLPFIENAFKHGINITKSSFIEFDIKATKSELMLRVENSNHDNIANRVGDSGGMGLNNVKRRLLLIYPDRHRLDIYSGELIYTVILKIQLQ